jgi:hypothetical protein
MSQHWRLLPGAAHAVQDRHEAAGGGGKAQGGGGADGGAQRRAVGLRPGAAVAARDGRVSVKTSRFTLYMVCLRRRTAVIVKCVKASMQVSHCACDVCCIQTHITYPVATSIGRLSG